ncbi:MAG: hypothetical protein JSS86_24350 [Cyanobacteria bacterium SZAS LIN-2]|nr:hypothetical protein [Cyanobacteria bacterium SZAS LIN-2]MBS2005623.1 hypothetical protein [Cyanobacteria bacterium SZAS TMP-1]
MPPRDVSDNTTPAPQTNHESSHALVQDSFPAPPRGNEVARAPEAQAVAGATSGNNAASPMRDGTQESAKNASMGLPNLELFDSQAKSAGAGPVDARQSLIDGAQKTLGDSKASVADKLSTVEKLAQNGIKNIQVPDADGKMRDYSVDVEKAGNRSMVHLYGKDDNGQDRVALRGVHNADGSFSQEKDRNGRDVGFTGSKWTDMQGKTTVGSFSGDQAGSAAAARPADGGAPAGRGVDNAATSGKPADGGAPAQRPGSDAGNNSGDRTPKAAERTEAPAGSIDRSQFDAQLNDPRVMAAFAGRMRSEVGSQGREAQVAFAEEVMNRAASRNQTLMQALSGRYYPTSHPGSSNNPEYISAITKAWKEGTDTTHGATGNASGRVGFGVAGGRRDANGQWVSPNQTVAFGGERFGHEQVDINKGWLAKYESLKRTSFATNQ